MKENTNIDIIVKKPFLSEKELEVYTGFQRRFLLKLRTEGTNKGKLPFNVIGRSIIYDRAEVDKFIRRHKAEDEFEFRDD